MTKASSARESALFLTSSTEHAASKPLSQRRKRAAKARSGLVDAIIDGERVLLATKPPTERTMQIQIVAALSAAGIRVLQHRIFPCFHCGRKPPKHAGLGRYMSDVLCIVPPYGRACFIELKRVGVSKNAKRDAHQAEFLKWIRHYGGVAGKANTIDEAFALVALARRLP